jgi:hypothetical protein
MSTGLEGLVGLAIELLPQPQQQKKQGALAHGMTPNKKIRASACLRAGRTPPLKSFLRHVTLAFLS